MHYGALKTLESILKNLQQDAFAIGIAIAGLMIVIYVIMIMFDTDTSPTAHTKRWDRLRLVFLCAALLSAAGALITFGQQLGEAIRA